jgi:transcriptional regulator with XRE-family HTH domain
MSGPHNISLAVALGEKLRAVREAAGVSQVELAERVGTTQPQIWKYETGAQVMNVARLYAIAGALGVAPYRLLV